MEIIETYAHPIHQVQARRTYQRNNTCPQLWNDPNDHVTMQEMLNV
jgi:hypothetical protein